MSTALVPIATPEPNLRQENLRQENLRQENLRQENLRQQDVVSHQQTGQRPRADFLAQLIATRAQAPQTRTRRRAEPQEAIAAYCACGRPALVQHRALSRSL